MLKDPEGIGVSVTLEESEKKTEGVEDTVGKGVFDCEEDPVGG